MGGSIPRCGEKKLSCSKELKPSSSFGLRLILSYHYFSLSLSLSFFSFLSFFSSFLHFPLSSCVPYSRFFFGEVESTEARNTASEFRSFCISSGAKSRPFAFRTCSQHVKVTTGAIWKIRGAGWRASYKRSTSCAYTLLMRDFIISHGSCPGVKFSCICEKIILAADLKEGLQVSWQNYEEQRTLFSVCYMHDVCNKLARCI